MPFHRRKVRGGGRGGKGAFVEFDLGRVEVQLVIAWAEQLAGI